MGEHSDSGDVKKISTLDLSQTTEQDPWSVKKSAFQKSKSVDVTIESGSSAASRFASYTTSKDTASTNKTEEDIPEWKKAMLERRRKDKEREEEEQKARNFGFIPGTTLHSSYVNKSYDNDSRLTSWGSASNLRTSNSYTNLTKEEEPNTNNSSGYSSSYRNSTPSSSRYSVEKTAEPELSPYEKYLQRKREQDKKDEEENRRKEEAKREEDKKAEKERLRRREEDRRKEEEAEKERLR